MLFERHPWTPWTVEIQDSPNCLPESYEEVFRTAFAPLQGKSEPHEWEQFTLLWKDSDECLLQIRMFGDGECSVEAYVPVKIRVSHSKNQVIIHFPEPLSSFAPLNQFSEND